MADANHPLEMPNRVAWRRWLEAHHAWAGQGHRLDTLYAALLASTAEKRLVESPRSPLGMRNREPDG